MRPQPLISLILIVKNGMPYVGEAVESVKRLSYPRFELVIQDGGSTDGTLELLESVSGIEDVRLAAENDSGIGDAMNRALERCRGEIIGSIDADNLLAPDALTIVAEQFGKHPDAAVIYGACDVIDVDGALVHTWIPPAFDLLRVMEQEVVPPFATSFFSRAKCGEEFRFDEALPTVPDFDLWLRLSHLEIVRIFDRLASVRVGAMSSTYNATNYDAFCEYKLKVLRRFLKGPGRKKAIDELRRRSESGIYLWAVDSMGVIGGDQERIDRYFDRAATTTIARSERFRRVARATRPRLSRRDAALEMRDIGLEHKLKGEYEKAALYLRLAVAAGVEDAGEMLEEVQQQVPDFVVEVRKREAEISRRDELLQDVQKQVQDLLEEAGRRNKEIQKRDEMLADLQQQLHETVDSVRFGFWRLGGRRELQTRIRRQLEESRQGIQSREEEIRKRDVLLDEVQRQVQESLVEIGKRDLEIRKRDDLLREVQRQVNDLMLRIQNQEQEIKTRDTLLQEVQRQVQETLVEVGRRETEIRRRDRLLEEVQRQVGELLQQAQSRDREIQRRDELLQEVQQQVQDSLVEVGRREAEVVKRDVLLQRLQQQVNDLTAEMQSRARALDDADTRDPSSKRG